MPITPKQKLNLRLTAPRPTTLTEDSVDDQISSLLEQHHIGSSPYTSPGNDVLMSSPWRSRLSHLSSPFYSQSSPVSSSTISPFSSPFSRNSAQTLSQRKDKPHKKGSLGISAKLKDKQHGSPTLSTHSPSSTMPSSKGKLLISPVPKFPVPIPSPKKPQPFVSSLARTLTTPRKKRQEVTQEFTRPSQNKGQISTSGVSRLALPESTRSVSLSPSPSSSLTDEGFFGSFSLDSKSDETTKSKPEEKSAFSFGVPNAQKLEKDDATKSKPEEKSAFSFGVPNAQKSTSESASFSSFSLDSKKDDVTKSKPEEKSAFSFGVPNAQKLEKDDATKSKPEEKSAFSFGVPNAQKSTSESASFSSFSLDSKKDDVTKSKPEEKSAFSFGVPNAQKSTSESTSFDSFSLESKKDDVTKSKPEEKSAFSFGVPNAQKSTSESTSFGSFSLDSKNDDATKSKPEEKSAFSFGVPNAQKSTSESTSFGSFSLDSKKMMLQSQILKRNLPFLLEFQMLKSLLLNLLHLVHLV
ncbi:hypothetical protein GEMRC1_007884 [Eukaryota sp. GEM-RC1]